MNLNVHPLLVHFPIAFLTGYSLLELARFPLLTRQSFYFYTKATFLFAGVIATGPAILAGLLIQDQFPNHTLVSLHQNINIAMSIIFFILAVGYLIIWINQNPLEYLKHQWWWPIKVRGAHLLIQTPVVFLLTLIGLGLLLVGGALGGIIVYGPNLDPFTSFIANILNVR